MIFHTFHDYYIPYYIGEQYRYPSGPTLTLIAVDKTIHIFRFEPMHWCTDSVFIDLIRVKTDRLVWLDTTKQLKLC